MKRWSKKLKILIEDKEVDKFLEDITNVCKKYNFSISHEDLHGSFIICEYHEDNTNWLMNADVYEK
jgi:hypothetical protein